MRPGTGLLNKPIPWPSGPLATHLRDARGESPIFTGFSAGHQIGLVAHDAYEWLDRLVDVAITSMAELLTARSLRGKNSRKSHQGVSWGSQDRREPGHELDPGHHTILAAPSAVDVLEPVRYAPARQSAQPFERKRRTRSVSRRALAPEIVAGLDADAGKDPFNVYGSPADPRNLRWRVDHEMGAAARVR